MTIIAADWDDLFASDLWSSLQNVNKYDGDSVEEQVYNVLISIGWHRYLP